MDPRLAMAGPRYEPQPDQQQVMFVNPHQETAVNTGDTQEPTSTKIYNMVTSRYGAALITVVCTFLILFFMKPPLIMQDITTNPYKKEYKINWIAVFIWSFVAGGLILCIEPILNYIKTQA